MVIREINMVSNCSEKYEEYPVPKKMRGNYFAFKIARVRDFLANAHNGLKRMQKKIKTVLSNLKFYARV